jgi:glycosyltransferase involved in cell wall biosynthesis
VKLGIVYDNFLSSRFGGGGAVHAYEVTTRLAKEFKVVLYPPRTAFRFDKDDILKRAKELETRGIKVADDFYRLLDQAEKYKVTRIQRLLFQEKTSAEYVKNFNVDVDFLYEPDHTSLDVFFFGEKQRFGLTIHEPLFYANSLEYLRRLWKFYRFNPSTKKGFYTRFLFNELVAKPKYSKLLRSHKPTFIASVSEGSLAWTGIEGEVLRPGNAFEPELLAYRNKGKEDYIVFWSRLNQDKGIQEIPEVMKVINSSRPTKLILMGKFFDKYNERAFWKKINKYNLHVEYLGFVERKKLIDVVSRAKVLVYPSHVDGFSLVVLESLALGTPVVAYDIPTVKSVYSDLPGVTFVREFDVRGMAEKALDFLRKPEKEIEDLMNDERLVKFLQLHSSWDNVVRAIKELLLKYVKA